MEKILTQPNSRLDHHPFIPVCSFNHLTCHWYGLLSDKASETLDSWFARNYFEEVGKLSHSCFFLQVLDYQGNCLGLSGRSLVFSSAPLAVSCWTSNFERALWKGGQSSEIQKSLVQLKISSPIDTTDAPVINSHAWGCAMKSAVCVLRLRLGRK